MLQNQPKKLSTFTKHHRRKSDDEKPIETRAKSLLLVWAVKRDDRHKLGIFMSLKKFAKAIGSAIKCRPNYSPLDSLRHQILFNFLEEEEGL